MAAAHHAMAQHISRKIGNLHAACCQVSIVIVPTTPPATCLQAQAARLRTRAPYPSTSHSRCLSRKIPHIAPECTPSRLTRPSHLLACIFAHNGLPQGQSVPKLLVLAHELTCSWWCSQHGLHGGVPGPGLPMGAAQGGHRFRGGLPLPGGHQLLQHLRQAWRHLVLGAPLPYKKPETNSTVTIKQTCAG